MNKSILPILLLVLCNCLFIHHSQNVNIFAYNESIRYDNSTRATVEFKMGTGNSKLRYFSKKPLTDSILIYEDICAPSKNRQATIFGRECGDGYKDIRKFQYKTTDSSIFSIDTIYFTNCINKLNICPIGNLILLLKRDGKANLIVWNQIDTIIAEVSIQNNKIIKSISGCSYKSYSNKWLHKGKLSIEEYDVASFNSWAEAARMKCK